MKISVSSTCKRRGMSRSVYPSGSSASVAEGRLRNSVAQAWDESFCLPSLLSPVAVNGVSLHLGRKERREANITVLLRYRGILTFRNIEP